MGLENPGQGAEGCFQRRERLSRSQFGRSAGFIRENGFDYSQKRH